MLQDGTGRSPVSTAAGTRSRASSSRRDQRRHCSVMVGQAHQSVKKERWSLFHLLPELNTGGVKSSESN
jgi:hypothetical protein